jgi:hypothetical protein
MLMTVAAAIFNPTSRDTLGKWIPPVSANVRMMVALVGALLDIFTVFVVLREQRKAIRIATIFHSCLLIPAMVYGDVPLAIIRMLAASCLARLLACLVELDWAVRGQPLSLRPSPNWLQGGCVSPQSPSAFHTGRKVFVLNIPCDNLLCCRSIQLLSTSVL